MPTPRELEEQADAAEERGSEKAEALRDAADTQRQADEEADAALEEEED
ncbi:MAG: hypothetical protein ACM3TU_02625 [Bacillota bacterium]